MFFNFIYRKTLKVFVLALTSIVLFSSCENMRKDINLDLPPFESDLVIEGYIEDSTLRVAVTQTQDYFAEGGADLTKLYVNDAKVWINFNNITDTLFFTPVPDFTNLKFFNYKRTRRMHYTEGETFVLTVADNQGRVATAQAQAMQPVPIDSVTYTYKQNDTTAYLLIYFTDDGSKTNYYRIMTENLSDTFVRADGDFSIKDGIFNGEQLSIGTGFDFRKGDIVQITLYHLSEEYYNYLNTMQTAASANGNPFGSPATIKGNINGGIGIFTVLTYDRKRIMLQ